MSAGNGIFSCGDRATEIAVRHNIRPQRPKDQKPVAQIPAQTTYLNLAGNYPGSGGLAGGGSSPVRTGLCIENPCFATRAGKSRKRLADPTDEKRSWQSGLEQPALFVEAEITGNLRALIRELKDAEQGPLQKRRLNA
jgi:hypothetical protein